MGIAKYAEEIRENYYERMEEFQWRRTTTCLQQPPMAAINAYVRDVQECAEVKRDFQDIALQCRDCGRFFLFSARDQLFYAKKGFSRPKRCKACRNTRQVLAIGFGR